MLATSTKSSIPFLAAMDAISPWMRAGLGGFCLLVCVYMPLALAGGTIAFQMLPHAHEKDEVPLHFQVAVDHGSNNSAPTMKWNYQREVWEQQALLRTLRPGESVLNIGGNVGTSCILIQKATESGRTFCVEPDMSLMPILRQNFADTSVESIEIVPGLITDSSHCPEGVAMHGSQSDAASAVQDAGGSDERLPKVMEYGGRRYEVQACYSLQHIASLNNNRMTSVIFADCEGCLPLIYQQFRQSFAASEVRAIIYERDGVESQHIEQAYVAMEADLRGLGFVEVSRGFVCTWRKGPPEVLVRLWLLFFLAAIPWAVCRAVRDTTSSVALRQLCAFALFTSLCHFVRVRSDFDWTLVEGLTGHLSSSWPQCLTFVMLWRYAFIYAAIVWPVAGTVGATYQVSATGVCVIFAAVTAALGHAAAEFSGVVGTGRQYEFIIRDVTLLGAVVLNVLACRSPKENKIYSAVDEQAEV
mmetsp:Transcript_69886/g.167756  ORF Transcript_69886/g.167756 Transcript_69886/m.167756 type:complete len:472 (+) Transcript_69886:99-1514(+)|eukprot:CAMPEP_0178423200 /NCGR_PEP_ID=MMETSP0689_2-20121128/27566_1 /TAXON_ID=160604 /ORGANISM="Amphidinium massartii, Strain CS-259" /LENGTH=471 /DNA_ID=CAMNT_0020044787 /DNA_START=30 /DNA_END=1445 /DNA_ORIENTATION=+